MKIRKILKNKILQKNAIVYEDKNKIIVEVSNYGTILDCTAIERKEFNSVLEYKAFEKAFSPTNVQKVSPFKRNK